MATAFLESFQGTAGLLPLPLDTQCHATRFCHFPCMATLSPWCSNQRLLFATKWSLFSFVSKISKILLPLLVKYFKNVPQPSLFFYTPGPQHQLVYQHCFPDNSPLLSSPSFPISSTQHAALPGPLATVFHSMKKTNFDATALPHAPSESGFPPRSVPAPLQMMNTNCAVVEAASFFSLKAEALSLVNLRTSSLPAWLSKPAFWRKKRATVPQISKLSNKRKHHKAQ